MLNALVFDAYGTLFNVNALDQRLGDHFGERAPHISATWRRKQLEYTWLRTLMDRYRPFSEVTQEALNFACKEAGVSLTDAIRHDLMKRYFQLDAFPEVPGLLRQLSRNIPLAILSNANLDMLEGAVAHNQIGKALSHIFSVDPTGHFKPFPGVYQMAVDKLGISKQNIGFVSSNTWDVSGAKSFGLFAIWLNRGNRVMEQMGFDPDLEISHLQDLLVYISE